VRLNVEFYDLHSDSNEENKLIGDPKYDSIRLKFMAALKEWTVETNDYIPSKRTADGFDRVTGEPDHSVRVRPRCSKQEMFGTNGRY
jgi:hypothetical protein